MTDRERPPHDDGAASGQPNEIRRKQRMGEDLSEPLKPDEGDWLDVVLEEAPELGSRENGSVGGN